MGLWELLVSEVETLRGFWWWENWLRWTHSGMTGVAGEQIGIVGSTAEVRPVNLG